MSLTSSLFNPNNRFGFHKELLLKISPDYKDRNKMPCYIPSRIEVFRWPISDVKAIISNWFENAPAELKPSPEQKQAVLELLNKRLDAKKIQTDIDEIAAIEIQ